MTRTGSQPMHADEITIDESLVRQLLLRQLPQWAGLPLKRVDSTGTVNAIFRLGDRLAVRLPRTARWHNVEAECCWLQSLAAKLSLAVPEPLAIGEPDDKYPFKWAVFRWLEGENWRVDRLDNPSSEAARLAEFLHELHAVEAGDSPCPECMERPNLEDRDRAVRAFAEDGRLVGVIDWASTHRGDPARDLQPAWRLFSGESRRVFRSAMAFDEDTWERARGWVLTSIIGVLYYAQSNPRFAEENRLALEEALADTPAATSS